MTEQAPTFTLLCEEFGKAALASVEPPPRKFRAIDGDRRRFHDRSPGRADLKIVKPGDQS